MPRTSTTRRGNGAGHGGPAKGRGWGGDPKGASAAQKLAPAGDDYSDQIRALSRDPKHAEAKAPLRELALTAWVEVIKDAAHPQRVVAAEKLMDRLDGKPTQPTDLTSKGERMGYVITAPPESEDADAWAQQHRPN